MRKLLALALLAASVLHTNPSVAASANHVMAFRDHAMDVLAELNLGLYATEGGGSEGADYALTAEDQQTVLEIKQQTLGMEAQYGPSPRLDEVTDFANKILNASALAAKPSPETATADTQAAPPSRPQMEPGAATLLLTGYSYYLGNRTCEENGFSAPGLEVTINTGVRQIISETGISAEAQDFIWAQTTSALVATPPQVDATECFKMRQAMAMAFPKYFPFTPAATEPNPFR
ncbi:hypothetical protein ELH94_22505 [Rhizobium leguminosarum]|uniref:hypothetical protein n=1 Tax=Rhizobium leguminosarum TaxID=384 RepID=UPI001030315E|nr:hypothetical protein [Rhizobium leguminosarum]TAX99103.1 hypothetical protein ELH94_22505 [Rhizobium leguminosarum]